MLSIVVISTFPVLEEVLQQWNIERDIYIKTFPSYNVWKQASDESGTVSCLIWDITLSDNTDDISSLQECAAGMPVLAIYPDEFLSKLPPGINISGLVKPLSIVALFTKLETLLIRSQQDVGITIGKFVLLPQRKLLSYTGELGKVDVSLTEKELEIILYLNTHNVSPTNRQTLLTHIWGYDNTVDTHTVETHIYRLRQKIAEICEGNTLIMTESSGYSLCGG